MKNKTLFVQLSGTVSFQLSGTVSFQLSGISKRIDSGIFSFIIIFYIAVSRMFQEAKHR